MADNETKNDTENSPDRPNQTGDHTNREHFDGEHQRYLFETYSDLLISEADTKTEIGDKNKDVDGGVDAALVRVVEVLDVIAHQYEPPPSTVNSIGNILREHSSRSVHHPLSRKQALGRRFHDLFARTGSRIQSVRLWLGRTAKLLPKPLLLLLMALVLVGAAYSTLSVIDQAFLLDTGTAHIAEQKLGVELGQAQTRNGFTLTVKRAYADQNRIVIGYTIQGPQGRDFNNLMAWGDIDESLAHPVATLPILTDSTGTTLGILGHNSDRDLVSIYGTDVQSGENAQVITYQMSPLQHADKLKEIQLRFYVGEITAYEQTEANQYSAFTVDGPFIFDFTLPIANP